VPPPKTILPKIISFANIPNQLEKANAQTKEDGYK
jgi:hypothetical protein